MRLEPLCRLDLRYVGDFHLARPFGGESGTGWGRGDGVVTGERLSGAVVWSNHPRRRADGAMLPQVRGVITTRSGSEVLVDLSGRTVWVERERPELGRQLLLVLMESEQPECSWLNDVVCVAEGVIDAETMTSRIEVFVCVPET